MCLLWQSLDGQRHGQAFDDLWDRLGSTAIPARTSDIARRAGRQRHRRQAERLGTRPPRPYDGTTPPHTQGMSTRIAAMCERSRGQHGMYKCAGHARHPGVDAHNGRNADDSVSRLISARRPADMVERSIDLDRTATAPNLPLCAGTRGGQPPACPARAAPWLAWPSRVTAAARCVGGALRRCRGYSR